MARLTGGLGVCGFPRAAGGQRNALHPPVPASPPHPDRVLQRRLRLVRRQRRQAVCVRGQPADQRVCPVAGALEEEAAEGLQMRQNLEFVQEEPVGGREGRREGQQRASAEASGRLAAGWRGNGRCKLPGSPRQGSTLPGGAASATPT